MTCYQVAVAVEGFFVVAQPTDRPRYKWKAEQDTWLYSAVCVMKCGFGAAFARHRNAAVGSEAHKRGCRAHRARTHAAQRASDILRMR